MQGNSQHCDSASEKSPLSPKSTCFKFKQLDVGECVLLRTRIDIWQYPLHTVWSGANALLNQTELKRAQQYYFLRHQKRFTVARATLRLILSRYIQNTNPNDLEFTENQYGKPELSNANNLQFNLSHSGDLALLAVGKDYPLGIDLEFFSGRPYLGIGNKMFSTAENYAFNQVNSSLRPLSFFHIWAQKEALIKACGLGLSYPTQQFDVPHLPATDHIIHDSLHDKAWRMISFMPKIACGAALCHHPDVTEIRYISLENNCDLT